MLLLVCASREPVSTHQDRRLTVAHSLTAVLFSGLFLLLRSGQSHAMPENLVMPWVTAAGGITEGPIFFLG